MNRDGKRTDNIIPDGERLKEFEAWKQGEGIYINTPDELSTMIHEPIKKQEANLNSRLRNSFNCVVDELIL